MTLKGHTGSVNSVAFSPDGKRLASASDDGTIKLWDVGHGAGNNDVERAQCMLWTASPSAPTASASPRQAMTIQSNCGTWPRGRKHDDIERTYLAVQRRLQPRRQAPRLRQRRQTIKLWDVATGQETMTLKGHSRMMSRASPSAPTASASPLAATTGRSNCGTWPQDRKR